MNLLITGAWQQAKEYICEIERQGHTVAFLQFEQENLPCDYEWVEGVVCNGLFLYHDIEKFTNLKYIQIISAGYDRVPMDYVRTHGIKINNARGVYRVPMAEYVLGNVLYLYRQAAAFAGSQKLHQWQKRTGLLELFEKNVCIVGCGSIGTECAKRFEAFGCHVTGVATKARMEEHYEKIVGIEDLGEALANTDIVVLALPLMESTKGLMNAEMFAKMKQGAILVNVARGPIVDEEALIGALEEKLGGAVLDVFTEEPLKENSPLWDMDHVIVTPHNSFVGEGNGKRLADVIMKGLKTIE